MELNLFSLYGYITIVRFTDCINYRLDMLPKISTNFSNT